MSDAAALDDVTILRLLSDQGGRFCKVKAKDKRPLEKAWQKKPYTLDQVQPHLSAGGNVGLLCGYGNLGLLDVDDNFSGFCERFPELANGPAIVRDGGDKGKLLLQIGGDIPPGKKFKLDPTDKHPFLEWLSAGNQGVIPPSIHPDGMPYRWTNPEAEIPFLTQEELSDICQAWTGSGLDLPSTSSSNSGPVWAAVNGATTSGGNGNHQDDKRKADVMAAWTVLDVFTYWGYAGDQEQERSGELRLKGHGGLLLSKDRLTWSIPGMGKGWGGGIFEAWAYCSSGGTSCDKPTGQAWFVLLEEMEQAAGISPAAKAAAGSAFDLDKFLLDASFDHDGHARCVNAMHNKRFAYSEQTGWLAYNGRNWERDNAALAVDRAIVATLKKRQMLAIKGNKEDLVKKASPNNSNVYGTRELLKSLVAVNISEFDKDPDLLNCKNGVLNLKTGQLTPHDKNNKFTYCLTVDYDPTANPGAFVDFLYGATGNDWGWVNFLQVALGYSLTGHTWEECMFYLYGPTRSGKGTLTETIIAMMGTPLAIEADFQTFTAERVGDTQNFDLAQLKPCRFVAAAESNKNQPLNPAKLKQLTGRNHIRCAFKHRNLFEYQPGFKIWLSSNHPVNTDVDDDAAWGRLHVIKFPISHLGAEDKRLKQRLLQDDNLRGALRWIVDGAAKWYNEGLKLPPGAEAEKDRQRDAQDFVKQWLEERTTDCRQMPGYDPKVDNIASSTAYTSYKFWCEGMGVKPKLQNQFTLALKVKGFETGRLRDKANNNKQHRVILGLNLIDTSKLNQANPELIPDL